VLTQGTNGTSTLSTISETTFGVNRLYGQGSAMAVLTFIVVMAVSFAYIRFVGGNIRGMTEE
jgi:multiple sugar transport system permease protein